MFCFQGDSRHGHGGARREPKRDEENKREEIPLVQVFEKKYIKVKMKTERGALESSLAGTGLKAPGQPRLSYREIRPTTVGSYRPAGVQGLESFLFKPLSE